MKRYGHTAIEYLFLFVFFVFFMVPQADCPAQELTITEFMAANGQGIQDQDGDYSDWIEIYNPGRDPVSIGGWFLSNDVDDLTQWEFPAVVIDGQSFLMVFASGKDRTDPGDELHASFKLDRDGEYLALVEPDGKTIAKDFFPEYPRQLSDVSYGAAMESQTTSLIGPDWVAQLWWPSDDRLGDDWIAPVFDDTTWTWAGMGIGYDRTAPREVTLEDVTQPGDIIEPTSFNSPANEEFDKVIDNDPGTKYLNFDKLNAGFTVTPSAGPSIIKGLRLTSANDAPDRDPTSFTLLGSNDGLTFTEIAGGDLPDFPDRFYEVEITFDNDRAYSQYRLLFPKVRNPDAAVAMQIAEVEFLGSGGAGTTFAEWIDTDVEADMHGRRTSAYLRIPFVAEAGWPLDWLALHMRYDDGFAAFLNGVEVARANAPTTLVYNSTATANRPYERAMVAERFGLSDYAYLIEPGNNVLAIQALNDSADSEDFLIEAQLESTQVMLGDNGYFESPTPGTTNGQVSLGLVADPLVDVERGFYDDPFEVTLTCPTEGATIVYTVDGSEPTLITADQRAGLTLNRHETTLHDLPDERPTIIGGTKYIGPILVDRTTTLRAAAFLDGWRSSQVVTHTYLFLDDIVTQDQAAALAAGFPASWNGQAADYALDSRVIGRAGQDNYNGKYTATIRDDLQSLPSMCIVMDIDDMFGSQGIYSNPTSRGASWERAASLELIYPDGREGFQENAGIRIQGGAFRRFDLTLKKSFRMVFREEYGVPKLDFPLFGPDAAEEFDNFILRANSNDAWRYGASGALYIRDTFAMDTVREMGNVASHSEFVHLYINGLYWGLYNPVERPDAAFSASYRGGDKDTWDAINQDSAPDGNYEAWNRLRSVLSGDLSDDSVYEFVQGNDPNGVRNPDYEDLIDVDNMIDYMILNLYVGNNDWPHRNWWAGRDRNDGDGFQFYPWDTETALSGVTTNRIGVDNAVAQPYGALRANARFRRLFGDHVQRHFFNGGVFYVNPDSPAWDPAHPENNRPAARFAALADWVEHAIVGESARWGDQLNNAPYTRDEHWARERDNLLNNYFPRRSEIVLDQFRNAGLFPNIDAPVFNQQGGAVEPGFELAMNTSSGMIYYTLDGTDPIAPIQVRELSRTSFVTSDSPKRVLIPSTTNGGYVLGSSWQAVDGFDDAAWLVGTSGVGYDTAADYDALIGIDVDSLMRGTATSAFIRIPFRTALQNLAGVNFMTLNVRYDDGFVAYLNGVQIAADNAPAAVQWDSVATAGHDDSAATQFVSIDVSQFVDTLQGGNNLLAIHGLNVSVSSSDFLIDAELVAGQREVIGSPPTSQEYTGPITLTDTVTVKARAFDGFEWSALNEAVFSVGSSTLVITELHYHPSNPTVEEEAAGFDDENDFEFIELLNAGTASFDLVGVRFVDGIEFDFTEAAQTLLAPGRSVLLVKDVEAFEARYGSDLTIAGQYDGRLSNSGETIKLVDAADQTLAEFTYGTVAPWPDSPDGAGPSLELANVMADPTLPESWQASDVAGGSPGTTSF